MAKRHTQRDEVRPQDAPPPGATKEAMDHDREQFFDQDEEGHDLGDRHAAGDPGGGNTSTGLVGPEDGDMRDVDGQDALENGPPYAGHAGGAVGGTPAERRARGGHVRGGIAPESDDHEIDRTVGSKPAGKRRKK
jgi:hypothetical protein